MIEIRAATTDEEYQVYAATQRRIFPGAPSLDEFRHRERTWAAFHAIAYLDGAPAGTGFAGVFPGAEAEPDLSCGFGTVPELRERGVGTALHRALSGDARRRGKHGLVAEVMADDPESLAWALQHGFEEVERRRRRSCSSSGSTTRGPSSRRPASRSSPARSART